MPLTPIKNIVQFITSDLLFQAPNRGTDVGRSPAIERRVNLRSRDQSPAPSGRTGVVNGAFVSTRIAASKGR